MNNMNNMNNMSGINNMGMNNNMYNYSTNSTLSGTNPTIETTNEKLTLKITHDEK